MSVRNLRPQSVFGGFGGFDDLTPSYRDEGGYDPNQEMISVYEQPYQTPVVQDVLDPTGQPLQQRESAIAPPTIEAPKVNPNSGMTLKDWFNAINEGYTPQTYARDRFNNVIDQFPTRQSPSGGMRWAAALQGMSQVGRQGGDPGKTVNDILSVEGNRYIDDWKDRIDPYHKAAQLEGNANIQERTLAGNAVTGYANDRRLAETARNNDMKNEAAMIRSRAYAAKNSGMEIIKAGSRLIGINPNTKERVDLGASGMMDREEEINLLGEWGVKRAQAAGSAALERARIAGAQIMKDEDGNTVIVYPGTVPPTAVPVQGAPKGLVKPETPRTGAGGQTSQLEKNRVEQKKLEDLWLTDPYARRFIKKQGNEYVRGKRPIPHPDTWWPNDHVPESDATDYDAFWSKHDPNYKPPTSMSGGPNTGKVQGEEYTESTSNTDPRGYTAGSERPGAIRMRAPDGSIRYVPTRKVAEAEKNGMRRLR